MWKPVEEIVAEFKKAEAAGATMSAVAMGYICLDWPLRTQPAPILIPCDIMRNHTMVCPADLSYLILS